MPEPSEQSGVIPPRYRWTRRIARALLITVAVLILLRLAWGWEARRRLNAAIRELRGPGRPLLAEDFKRPDLPDDRNAATLLIRAGQNPVRWIGNSDHLARMRDGTPTQKDIEWVGNLVRRNQSSLALVRSARGLEANWNVVLDRPTEQVGFLMRVDHRLHILGDVLQHAAKAAHHRGEHAEAVEYLRDMVGLARALYARPYTISQFAAFEIDCKIVDTLPRMGQGLIVAAGDGARLGVGQVRVLMDELLDDKAARDGKLLGIHGDRLLALDYFRTLRDRRPSQETDDWLRQTMLDRHTIIAVSPALDLKAERRLRHLSSVAQAFEADNFPVMHSRLPAVQGPTRSGTYPVELILRSDAFSRHHYFAGNHFFARTVRRAMAISLAIRLYRHDHDDRWPQRLEPLIPNYLPAVPSDPFAADARAMRYISPPRPIVYSVSVSGGDDLASRRWTLPAQKVGGPPRWSDPDLVFELGP